MYRMRGYCTPHPGKVHNGYTGIMDYYSKRTEKWKTGHRIGAEVFINHYWGNIKAQA